MSMPTLWVEVTTLLRVPGYLTGIQRVLASLLREWHAMPGVVLRLCNQEGDNPDGYAEVPAARLHQIFEQLADNSFTLAPKAPPPAPLPPPPQPPRSPLRRVVGGTFRRLPADMQEALMHLACVGRLMGRPIVRRFRRPRPLPPPPPPPPSPPRAEFKPGDILFLGDGSWWTKQTWTTVGQARRDSVRVATVIYDLIPLKLPQLFTDVITDLFRDWFRQALAGSDLMLSISSHTRDDLHEAARTLGRPAPPVEVIRLGDELHDGAEQRPHDLPPVDEFILFVSTVEPRKNHYLAYHLWHRLVEQHGTAIPPLVCAGRPGWLANDLICQMQKDPLLRGRLLLLPHVSDPELRWLYRHCRFTIYPSHYEGWGLPVAEALAHGKYCISSGAASLPEIAGDLIDYHDPLDVLGCQRLVEQALFDPAFLAGREQRIRGEFRVTPWQATATQVLEALRRTAA